MMDRNLAKVLLPIVANPAFEDAIKAYRDYRLRENMKGLRTGSDLLVLGRFQGAQFELDEFVNLYARAKQVLEDANK